MDDIILPIGTVCSLKEGNKKIMITAFFISEDSNSNEVYDYCGCLWPEGMIDSGTHFLFNKEQIDKIHHIGFSNDEEKEFKKNLSKVIKEVLNSDGKVLSLEEKLNINNNNNMDDNDQEQTQSVVNPINFPTEQVQQSNQQMFTTLNLNNTNNNQ